MGIEGHEHACQQIQVDVLQCHSTNERLTLVW